MSELNNSKYTVATGDDMKTVTEEITKINDNLKWTKLGETTGKTELPLPSKFNELSVKIVGQYHGTVTTIHGSFHLRKEMLNDSDCMYTNSRFVRAGDLYYSINFSLKCTTTKISIESVGKIYGETNNTDISSTAKMEVWYR